MNNSNPLERMYPYAAVMQVEEKRFFKHYCHSREAAQRIAFWYEYSLGIQASVVKYGKEKMEL